MLKSVQLELTSGLTEISKIACLVTVARDLIAFLLRMYLPLPIYNQNESKTLSASI